MKFFALIGMLFLIMGSWRQVTAQPATDDLALLQNKITDDRALVQKYDHAINQENQARVLGQLEDLATWESASNQVLHEIVPSRQAAVDLAMKIYKISPFVQNESGPPWELDLSPYHSVDWMIGPWGKGVLGNHAFESPARLGASLWALKTLWDHLSRWPYSVQDQHLTLALAEKQVVSKAQDLNLSPKEVDRLTTQYKHHEDLLDPSRKTALIEGKWPSPPSLTTLSKSPKNALIYAPPFLNSADRFFKLKVMAQRNPVPDLPILVGHSKELGYLIDAQVITDKNGEARVEVSSATAACLLAPLGVDGPWAHRLPLISGIPPSSTEPNISPVPMAVETQTEQIFTGSNLMEAGGKTTLTVDGEEVPLLASSPSLILAQIPSRLPGPKEVKLATPAGAFQSSIPLVVLRGELRKKSLNRGEHSTLTIQQWGLPSVEVWVAIDHPHLLLGDSSGKLGTGPGTLGTDPRGRVWKLGTGPVGTSPLGPVPNFQVVSLVEKTPVEVPIQGYIPGPFKLTFGIVNPSREEALSKLNAMKPALSNAFLMDLLDQTTWALQSGEIGETEGLIERLRYESLIRENKMLPTDEILTLIR